MAVASQVHRDGSASLTARSGTATAATGAAATTTPATRRDDLAANIPPIAATAPATAAALTNAAGGGGGGLRRARDLVSALFSLGAWQWVVIYTLIFGGCCSNVFTLELLVRNAPKSGHLFTLAQFVFVAIDGLFRHVEVPTRAEYHRIKQQANKRYSDKDSSASTQSNNGPSNPFIAKLEKTLDGIGDWVEQLIVGILPRWIPRLKARKIPAYRWMVMVFLFFVVSVLNNWALGFEISVPLHIIFRSGGLIVNMIMGWLIVSKRYSQRQIFAVIFVTLGVVLATFGASGVNRASHAHDNDDAAQTLSNPKLGGGDANIADAIGAASNVSESFLARYGVSVEWVTGIAILTIALVFSALLGLFQEFTYRRYGNQWREGLFYSHFYALPFFLMFYSDIVKSIHEFNDSAPIDFIGTIPIVGQLLGQQDTLAGSDAIDNNNVDAMMQYRLIPPVMVPSLWVYCFWNMVTQYFCIAGVHRMTGVATSLTLNLVLNVRKLVSLVLSIILFSNPFTAEMSYGCFMVIIGTAMYSLPASSSTPPAKHISSSQPAHTPENEGGEGKSTALETVLMVERVPSYDALNIRPAVSTERSYGAADSGAEDVTSDVSRRQISPTLLAERGSANGHVPSSSSAKKTS